MLYVIIQKGFVCNVSGGLLYFRLFLLGLQVTINQSADYLWFFSFCFDLFYA